MNLHLHDSIKQQREMLTDLLAVSMHRTARRISPLMSSTNILEILLISEMAALRHCKYMYVLNASGNQITGNVTPEGIDASQLGRDRSHREYMQGIIGTTDFRLSDAYISENNKRPSITAVQVIRNASSERVGFLGADYDLRELPHSENIYRETTEWRQLKGDPAIRGGLFTQRRIDSVIDARMSDVLVVIHELMAEHGVFHGKIHFSSNRATIWLTDSPYHYRLLSINELIGPDICLAYPRRTYPDNAVIPVKELIPVLDRFRELRFADENIYLRSGSLNIFNGLVGLNFSCDGSHYMHYGELLEKDMKFWLGMNCAV